MRNIIDCSEFENILSKYKISHISRDCDDLQMNKNTQKAFISYDKNTVLTMKKDLKHNKMPLVFVNALSHGIKESKTTVHEKITQCETFFPMTPIVSYKRNRK